MGKRVMLSLKVPEEIQKKLKIYSTLSGESMADIISDFVDSLDVDIPDFLVKKKTVNKEIKKTVKKTIVNKEIKKAGIYDPDKVKKRVLALKAENLSYNQIAETLESEGFSTRQGGTWSKDTVSNIYRRAIAAETLEDASQ